MTEVPRSRYGHWDDVPDDETPTSADPGPPFREHAVIMREPHSDRWHAVWGVSPVSMGGEFYGTRQETIDWALTRSGYVQIWSDEAQDLVLLAPIDEDHGNDGTATGLGS